MQDREQQAGRARENGPGSGRGTDPVQTSRLPRLRSQPLTLRAHLRSPRRINHQPAQHRRHRHTRQQMLKQRTHPLLQIRHSVCEYTCTPVHAAENTHALSATSTCGNNSPCSCASRNTLSVASSHVRIVHVPKPPPSPDPTTTAAPTPTPPDDAASDTPTPTPYPPAPATYSPAAPAQTPATAPPTPPPPTPASTENENTKPPSSPPPAPTPHRSSPPHTHAHQKPTPPHPKSTAACAPHAPAAPQNLQRPTHNPPQHVPCNQPKQNQRYRIFTRPDPPTPHPTTKQNPPPPPTHPHHPEHPHPTGRPDSTPHQHHPTPARPGPDFVYSPCRQSFRTLWLPAPVSSRIRVTPQVGARSPGV